MPARAVLAVVGVLLASPSAAAAAPCAGADLPPSPVNVPAIEEATLCLLNQKRAGAGVPSLIRNVHLDAASRAHSRDMVGRRFFAHDAPDGTGLAERMTTAGYLSHALATWNAGENIAWGYGALAPPAAIVDAWMASPPHRENVLERDYREVGIGVALGVPVGGVAAPGATYTADFGTRVVAAESDRPSTASRAVKRPRHAKRRCQAPSRRRAKAQPAAKRRCRPVRRSRRAQARS
jgi:uncharacterized protein YkwD